MPSPRDEFQFSFPDIEKLNRRIEKNRLRTIKRLAFCTVYLTQPKTLAF